MKKIIIAMLFCLSLLAFISYSSKSTKKLRFENINIIDPSKYVELITPENIEVKRIAKRVQEPVKAYYYVRDFIDFDPTIPTSSPEKTILSKKGNCLSKAVLLVSLYRCLKIPEEHVRIVIGELHSEKMIVEHAWIEVKYNGSWYQQDPTDLIGLFSFDQFKERQYFNNFVRKENYCFNDTGFAIVSQRNRFK